MSSSSRIDRLIALIGGPENLPPKLPQAEPEPEPETQEGAKEPEASTDLVTVESFLEQQPVKPPSWVSHAAPPSLAAIPPTPQTSVARHVNGDFVFEGRKGEPSSAGINFCPFAAVAKFCYKFVPASLLQQLATNFFDSNKIYQRNWSLYYISSDYNGVTTFVPESELRTLLTEINERFSDAKLSINKSYREKGLVIDFEDLPQRLRPRWLGHLTSREQLDSWTDRLRSEPNMVLAGKDVDDRSVEAFKAKMDLAAEAARAKARAGKQRKLQETIVKRHGMAREVLKAQKYLGLIPDTDDDLLPDLVKLSLSPFDVNSPPSHTFVDEPIFIAIDVEAYERPPRPITEVGVATLDVRDLHGMPPGEVGKEWHKFIRARHFRVLEYKDYVNHEFVHGCPEAFEFGDSELITIDKLAKTLTTCFHEPFSGKAEASHKSKPATRNIIIVGHDLGQDIDYCKRVGFNPFNRGNILGTVDTSNMYRTYARTPQARSLGGVLYDFDLMGWNLHNAGNDAVYTMQALLAICVKAASERGSEAAEKQREEVQAKKTEEAVAIAKERIEEDSKGWDFESGSDGGAPLPNGGPDLVSHEKQNKSGW